MATTALQGQVLLLGSSQESELSVVDAATGGSLYTFKQCSVARFGVQVVPRTEHIVAVQEGKLATHAYTWSKDAPAWKSHSAEKLGPTAVTSCGNFFFAGAQSGKVYVWDVKTGELVMVWDAHYKAVSAMALTSDNAHVITAGDDAVVHVWRLMDILDTSDPNAGFQTGLMPLVSWTDHALPVTSICVGRGGVNARIFTSSLDRTCKIWSLHSNQCLYSITCPSAIFSCITDLLEQRMFLGCSDGKIYTVDLHAAATALTAATARIVATTTVSGASGSSVAPWTHDALLPEAFEGHEVGVTMLQVSVCGTLLISGDDDGVVRVWDTVSRQSLRTIRLFKGKITVMTLMSKPRNLFHKTKGDNATGQRSSLRNGNFGSNVNDPRGALPIAPFRKYMGATTMQQDA